MNAPLNPDIVPVLYTAIGGLSAAIVFLFKLNNASQERRNAETQKAAQSQLELVMKSAEDRIKLVLEHHTAFVADVKKERAEHTADRERYIAKLEELTTKLASERLSQTADMMRILQDNSEAIRLNTTAREQTQKSIEEILEQVVATVLVKLVEMKVLQVPPGNGSPLEG
jgi:flagellar biosynthesis GTPase FlhF